MPEHDSITVGPETRIIFPAPLYQVILEHCRRKLSGNYLADENQERKAFGLVGGHPEGDDYRVGNCFPLLKNARSRPPYAGHMDSILAAHAIPSETPLQKRGWIAEPEEFMNRIKQLQQQDMILLGAYHMHRVPWPDDPLRDGPTSLDTILAAGSRMIIFIISMVQPDQPRIRAFYEGRPDMEVAIQIV